MSDDRDVLDPIREEVAYRGKTVEVTPLRVGSLPMISRLVAPMLGDLKKLAPGLLEGDAQSQGAEIDLGIEDVVDLVADHGDAVFEVVALAVEQPADWIRGGDVAEFAGLAKAILMVNRDFFSKMLRPLLVGQGAPAVAGEASSDGAGQTPSSSSSSAGTG